LELLLLRATGSGSAFNTKPGSVTFAKKAAPQAKTTHHQLQEVLCASGKNHAVLNFRKKAFYVSMQKL